MMKNNNKPIAEFNPKLTAGARRKIPMGFMDLKKTVVPNPRVFTEKHPMSKVLARYVLAGEGGATGANTVRAFVKIPSVRLNVGIRVGFEPDDGQDPASPTFNNTPTWNISVVSINPDSGKRVVINQAYPSSGSANLPDGYELNSAADMLLVSCTLNSNNFAASFLPTTQRGNCVLIATWEPNTEIPDEELRRLYSLCDIEASTPKLIQNVAV